MHVRLQRGPTHCSTNQEAIVKWCPGQRVRYHDVVQPMKAPAFEKTAIVTDDAVFGARISSLFNRPGKYLPLLDGPRMARQDHSNEVTRRRNALAMSGARHVLLAGLEISASAAIRRGWPHCLPVSEMDAAVEALKGFTKRKRPAAAP